MLLEALVKKRIDKMLLRKLIDENDIRRIR
jgi:hypothetical protein